MQNLLQLFLIADVNTVGNNNIIDEFEVTYSIKHITLKIYLLKSYKFIENITSAMF